MRAYLPAYDLYAPGSLHEALQLLSSAPGGWRPFAGGTDLMVLLESGALPEARYLGLWKLPELRGIHESDGGLDIGSLTTYSELLASDRVRREYPLIAAAAAETGGVATQNRGTIGGNIANASPAADTPPALLVYDAELEVRSVRGPRRLKYDAFHLGYKKMDLAPDELIIRIYLPKAPRGSVYYHKVGTRQAQAISKVCLAAVVNVSGGTIEDVRIALGSVAPTVVRARRVEEVLRGRRLEAGAIDEGVRALPQDLTPIDDLRSTARYRLLAAQRLLRHWLFNQIDGR